MAVSVKVTANLKPPRLDLDREVHQAARIVVEDIQKHMQQGRGLDGMPLPARSKQYEKWKSKSGFHGGKMFLHGILKRALAIENQGTNRRLIYIKDIKSSSPNDKTTRDKVGKYLQEAGNNWFGISDIAEGRIIISISNRIKRIIRYGR